MITSSMNTIGGVHYTGTFLSPDKLVSKESAMELSISSQVILELK
jgi:hypothetical protein